MKRRSFIENTSQLAMAISVLGVWGCKEQKKSTEDDITNEDAMEKDPFFKLSLAQWSIHRMINDNGVDPYSFAEKAKNWGFAGLEYVSQLYSKELEAANYSEEAMTNFVEKSNVEARKHGLKNVLIMIDRQGDLATTDVTERTGAVENHYKWVDAASAMGCHSIRVNLNGSDQPEEWAASAVDGLTKLATYAEDKNVNILVENHGGFSSNAMMLAEVMAKVNMNNCGTLPDFGNFCIRKSNPDDGSSDCAEEYDIYKGVKELMPYAKAVSAKTYNFEDDGSESKIDYVKMLKIVKNAGYDGFIGVEYEGDELSEEDGIMATKKLLIEATKKIS